MERTLLNQTFDAAKHVENLADKLLKEYDLNDFEALRRKRLNELKERAEKESHWRKLGHGHYTELGDEKDWFVTCKESECVITHFYRPTTWRCQIVDKHFEILAQRHLEARFIKVS